MDDRIAVDPGVDEDLEAAVEGSTFIFGPDGWESVDYVDPTSHIRVVEYTMSGTQKGPMGPILTMFVNRWNAMLTQRFANDPNIVVVETYDIFAFRDRLSFDRFHPKDEGYAAIARRIADAL